MKKLIAIPACGLLILASLYLVAGLFGGLGQIQVVRMLGLQDTSEGATVHLIYTTALFAGSLCGFWLLRQNSFMTRNLCLVIGSLIALFTILCIYLGITNSLPASYYEHYVGEGITVAVALLLLVTALFPIEKSPTIR